MKDPFLLILASAARSLTRRSQAAASGLTETTSALTSGSGERAPGFRRRILAALSPAFLTAAAPQEG